MLPSPWYSFKIHGLRFVAAFLCVVLALQAHVLLGQDDAMDARLQFSKQSSISQKDTHIGVKDILIYRVLEDRDAPIKLQVSEAGTVFIPYYGEISVANQSLSEAKEAITQALEGTVYKKASVFLSLEQENEAPVNSLVYLGGKVNKIGAIPLDPSKRNTVTKVILAAGGFADFADDTDVKLLRKLSGTDEIKTFHVNVAAVLEKGELDKDLDVMDGDFIIVPKRLFNW